MLTQIYNAAILLPDGRWLREGSLVIEDHLIREISENSVIFENVDYKINAKGKYVMPGCVDMHVHGGGGRDFMECYPEAYKTIVRTHRLHGTTSMFPTLASASEKIIRDAASICSDLIDNPESGVLGLHLEGPYFQSSMAGGQIGAYIRNPRKKEYEEIVKDYACVKRWDAAPELPGGMEFGRFLSTHGIVAGIAHTCANYKEIEEAYENGYRLATHFYNAMTGVHKRGIYKEEGTIESILLFDDIDAEVIADGVHVPPALLKLLYKIKGADRVALVTDAMALTDFDGVSPIDPRVVKGDGVCMLKDGSAIAGSCATMDRLIKTMVTLAGVPLADASRMASATPARIMGVADRKGALAVGKDADIIIMDEALSLTHVIVMGELIRSGFAI